ncbi:MAG TPA: hypothetical protein VHE12_08585 [bacterium]|nr:hypothetical protein [bacterium]
MKNLRPILIWSLVSPLWALGPMVQFQDLVAGNGQPGFADGAFYSAQFHDPLGMAMSPDGSILYVADRQNNRIREISLDHSNEVRTLTGGASPGALDGPFATATFYAPCGLLAFPDGSLLVNDRGNHLFRRIDIAAQKVSTLQVAPAIPGGVSIPLITDLPWNMACVPGDTRIFWTEPRAGQLRCYDPGMRKAMTLLDGDPRIPHPAALFGGTKGLFVAGQGQTQVFQVALGAREGQAPVLALTPVGLVQNALALAGSGDSLYALQSEPSAPVVRVFPNPKPVTFLSVWGKPMLNPSLGAISPLFQNDTGLDPLGFLSDSRSPGRFFVSNTSHSLVGAFRDLNQAYFDPAHGEDYWNQAHIHDFEYPAVKPPHTFRILLVGRCYLYWEADGRRFEGAGHDGEQENLMLGVCKKLEISLNAQAALEGGSRHFEVLNGAMHHGGNNLDIWANYVVPPLVRHYGIDLVVILQDGGFNFFDPYFISPMGKEGLPTDVFDPEYVLRPNKEKAQAGGIQDFTQLCRNHGLLHEDDAAHWSFDWRGMLGDPEVRPRLMGIMRKPVELLRDRIAGERTDGTAPRLAFWFYPISNFEEGPTRDFYAEMIKSAKVPYLDLCDDFTALELGFWPIKENAAEGGHFTENGMDFFSLILREELARNHYLPEEPGR